MGSNSRRARDLRIGAGAGVGLPADRTGAAASEEAIPAVVRVCGFAFDVPARDGAIDSIGTVRSAAIFGARGSAEAAGAVILEPSLRKVDELLHVGRRMRAIALQSAVGGMALSLLGMLLAALGLLPPVAGAVTQELIDVLAVVNALRVAIPPRSLSDY